MKTYKVRDPFRVERLRAILAEKSRLSDLSRTYSISYPEIEDQNSPELWDFLNDRKDKLINLKNPMEKDRLSFVVNLIQGNNISILNVGFGSGNLEQIYFNSNKNKFNWYGIEISPRSVKEASKRYKKGKFEIGNVLTLKNKSNFFDYAIALEVLEHIKPSLTFIALNEIFRVLKPRGYLIVSVPLNEGLEEMVVQNKNLNAHVRIYTPKLIRSELIISKFIVIKEKILYAFNDHYRIKTFIAKYVLPGIRQPNNIIFLAQKP